jgi:hypothetical protein
MKKIVLTFALTYGLFSCEKKTFYLLPGDWVNAHPGSDYCITNTTQW